MSAWVVTSQARADWPSKDYTFLDEAQARMFAHFCKREGDLRFELRPLTARKEQDQ